MKKSSVIWLVIIVIVVVAIVWWWAASMQPAASQSASSGQPAQSGQSGQAAVPTGTGGTSVITLNTGNSAALGSYLVATNGMTLYKYTPDATNVSNCTGQCAVIWPPYTVTSASSLAGGASVNGTIGTITRADGSLQVTYNGMPLYFYQKDKAPGDTTGQGVGGIWFVVAP